MKTIIAMLLFVTLSVLSCGGEKSSTTQPIVHTNFAGSWKADEVLYRANLKLNTSDSVHYTGSLILTSKETGLVLTADMSGDFSWGFTQSPTVCSSSASRTWMIAPFSNIQGHLFSSTDTISYADGTLWDYETLNFSQMNFSFGFNTGYGGGACTNLWFHRE